MLRLDFSYADLQLPVHREVTRRSSIFGVQDKVQLKRTGGKFAIVESGGDYILKPVPRNSTAVLVEDIPANEALTMYIASNLFGIRTAEHAFVTLSDGSPAYLTRRFDFRNGEKIRQEDFCQLSNRSEETHGDNYKYDASYEELAQLTRRFCPSCAVENPKIFPPSCSTMSSPTEVRTLRTSRSMSPRRATISRPPAYDLLNTSVHFPNEPTATGLEFFVDGHFTRRYEELGFYSSADFIELARCFGVGEEEVAELITGFSQRADAVARAVTSSNLSRDAQARYLEIFHDRLRAILR